MPVIRSFFQKIPFIRITSFFMVGILLNNYFVFDKHLIAIILAITLSLLILFWHNSNYTAIQIQNLLISASIVFSGVFYADKAAEKLLPTFSQKDYYIAEVCQRPAEKTKSFQTILQIQNKVLAKPEKVIVWFSKENFDSTITTGDQLILMGKPQEILNMGNPFEFDYQKMMQKKGIYFSMFLANGSYLKTKNHYNRVKYWSEKIRDNLIAKLSSSRLKKEELSVVAALTLGYRAELEPETIDYFASTGAMHVLAVSGLHVGLIYIILGFLFSGIKQTKFGVFIYPALLIIFLWSYAFISGFSPSVQRATVMFTFIIAGNVLRRPVNIYNSLTASALVLMLNNPNVLFEVGFQLSYMAVFGIVLIQPKLGQLIEVKNKLLKALWDLTTVSFAAQLATFPLGLFYFNQFPNYFWASNFIVIPGATMIIWVTFAFYISGFLPVIPDLISQFLYWITAFMLKLLKILSELPHALTEGIIINQQQVWLLYGLIFSILTYIFLKKKRWLFLSLIVILFFQVTEVYSNFKLINQKIVYAYNSRSNLIHLINGRNNYLVLPYCDSIPDTDIRIVQNVQNHLNLAKPVIVCLKHTHEFKSEDIIIEKKNIQFLNSTIEFTSPEYLKLRKSENLILKIQKTNGNKLEIVKTAITMGSSAKNKNEIDEFNFNTKLQGAFVIHLP